MPTAVQTLQKLFPQVTNVVNAKRGLRVEVTKQDASSAKVKNHKACAMAVACKRKFNPDGVLFGVSTAYMVRGNTATRYSVPQSVSREVVSFDRGGAKSFEPGEYRLLPNKTPLGVKHSPPPKKSPNSNNGNMWKRAYHQTTGIRAHLGSNQVV